jgi:uncharacterized protein (TIGR03083 family)
MTDIRELISGERRELAAVLADLPAEQWNAPTLCAGWRVREVVAHMTMPFRMSAAQFMKEMARARGNFDRMADRCARRDAESMSAEELVATLRDNVEHPWKPPGGGFDGALSHDVIHGLDITVALGIERTVPADRIRRIVQGPAFSKGLKHFGVELDGIELQADDIDWSFGSGKPLSGAAQDLLLVLCGRTLPAGHLRGESSDRFSMA